MGTTYNYSDKEKENLFRAEYRILRHLPTMAFVRYMMNNKNIICL